jgi:asparagine synthase (glutamine-hydrolysing)
MCGIAGIFDKGLTGDKARGVMEMMLRSMEHRGPDYSGIYADMPLLLGHNRLSIIDLSDAAHQPMVYQHLVIVLNGEIYNYKEIRRELELLGYRFRTQSDTEVAAAAYMAWRESCVDHFIGMWAFAIWDTEERTLFCSRDRFGIKPFSYILEGDKFYFASEYKALRKSPIFEADLNEQQIARGLNLGWTSYQDETYFEKIKNLPAGCNLVYDRNGMRISKYWDIDLSKKLNLTEDDMEGRFLELFRHSVELQMRSDVKLGTCLSGGLDSSSILSMVSHLYEGQPVDAFTIYYDGKGEVDERPWAQKVVEKYDNIRWHTYKPSNEELLEAFEKTHYHIEVPLSGSSPVSQYFVMQAASDEKVKVLLDGQGADEYLAGYMHAFDRLIGQKIARFQLRRAVKALYWHQKRHKLSKPQLLYLIMKSLIASTSGEQKFFQYAYKNKLEQVLTLKGHAIPFSINGAQTANSFDHYLYHQVFTTSLPSLLHYEDRNSMAFSIESRVPFLDHRLVEFCFQLGNHEKIKEGETKKILRNSLDGILPDAIRDRQDKKGFVTPGEDKWLRGPLKSLLQVDFQAHSFIDHEKATRVIQDYILGKRTNSLLAWRLISLNHWLKRL